MSETKQFCKEKDAHSPGVTYSAIIWQSAQKMRQRVVFHTAMASLRKYECMKEPGLHNTGHLSDGDKVVELADGQLDPWQVNKMFTSEIVNEQA